MNVRYILKRNVSDSKHSSKFSSNCSSQHVNASKSSNPRKFFDWIAEILNIHELDDWYKLTARDIAIHDGQGLLCGHFNDSPSNALISVYPETSWQAWRFQWTPRSYWRSLENRRNFLQWVADCEKICIEEDWYNITKATLIRHGGRGLLHYYGGSPSACLMYSIPDIDWQMWRFEKVPHGYWDEIYNQRKYFDWLAERKDMKTPQEWYSLTDQDIIENGGNGLMINRYQGSKYLALNAIYPDTHWQPWKFDKIPHGYWDQMENQLEFFNDIANSNGVIKQEDWYDIPSDFIIRNSGSALLHLYYNGNIGDALSCIYPNLDWQPWRFEHVSQLYWDDTSNQRRLFDWIAEELCMRSHEDWYDISKEEVVRCKANQLIDHLYEGLLGKCLSSIYQDTAWQLWRFNRRQHGYLDIIKRDQFIEWLEDKWSLSNPQSWYGITKERLTMYNYGRNLLQEYDGSMMELMKKVYPHLQWNSRGWLLQTKSRSQYLLYDMIRSQLPNYIEIEYESVLPFGRRDHSPAIFDIWIPYLNLAVEYQGIQHYLEHKFVHHEEGIVNQVKRDRRKQDTCNEYNIVMLGIPFWWNINMDVSLVGNLIEKAITNVQIDSKREMTSIESLLYPL
jgi:hypothetical protein